MSFLTLMLIIINVGGLAFIVGMHINYPRRVWEILWSLPSYIYFSASYIHTLVIYAFCNIDDFTWGTKGNSFFFNFLNRYIYF